MGRRGKGLSLVVVVVLAIAVDAASARVRYASPAGGGVTCTSAAPCTFRQAVQGSGVRAGDEVVVRPGTYNLGARQVVVAAAITVHGAVGRPRPKITSHDSPTLRVFDRRAVVSDLEITTTASSFPSAVWVSDGILERVFAHSAGAGCALAPTASGQVPLIRDSFCWGTGPDLGYGVWWAVGAVQPLSSSARLRNVTAVGRVAGIEVDAGSGPVQLSLDAVNVVARSAGDSDVAARADVSGASARVALRNSNYASRQTNAVAGGSATVTAPGSGANQTAAPVFRDPAHGDFHQRRTSPTFDAGIVTPLNGARDIDRQRRFQGSAPDIGADELPLA